MSTMSELDIELQLDWVPTWYGYEHRHSDYQIVLLDGCAVLEAKDWPHPILSETTLVGALAYVSRLEGVTWSRDLEAPDDDIRPGMILAGIAAMTVGAAVWAAILLTAWLVLR